MSKMEMFIEFLESGQTAFQKALDTFNGRLKTNPVYAFEWAETAMSLAARAEIFNECLAAIKNGREKLNYTDEQILKNIDSYLTQVVISGSRHPSHSTSICTNYIKEQKTAASAEVLETVKMYLRDSI